MKRPIIDAHCDVLDKMMMNPNIQFNSPDSDQLDVTLPRLKKVNMALQFFAIFIDPDLRYDGIQALLESVDLFQQKVLRYPEMQFVRNQKEMEESIQHHKIGALLTLEGVDALNKNFTYLRNLYYLGVRSVGITWNHANWAADGAMEPRQGGFTNLGKKLIKQCDDLGMILDVSHLSERGFWELDSMLKRPFIASHSNAYRICPHPRNLKDEQIQAIIRKNGIMGVTFVPYFVSSDNPSIVDIVRHIEHICALGGENHIGFGSDFDGIAQWVPGLENVNGYDYLTEVLSRYYSDEQVNKFLFHNWYRYLMDQLPRT